MIRIAKKIAPVFATSALVFTGMGVAQAATSESAAPPGGSHDAEASKGVFTGPDGKERALDEAPDGSGVVIELAEGDEVLISEDGQLATWVTESGQGLIEFNAPTVNGDSATFVFEDGVLSASAPAEGGGALARSCWQSKATEFGWNILWNGLVCVPIGIGTGGVGGFLCGAAGAGISVFVPWEDVCG